MGKLENRPPGTRLLLSLIHESDMTTARFLAEIVDNSKYAKAGLLDITIGPDEMRASDNGQGCSDARRIVDLAVEPEQDVEKIGFFGVGVKTGSMPFVSIMEAHTKTAKQTNGTAQRADWDGMIESGQFLYEEIECIQAEIGTTVVFREFREDAFHDLARAMKELPYLFEHSLRSGFGIRINGTQLEAPTAVELINARSGDGEWHSKLYEWRAGVLPANDTSRKCGWTVIYNGHRRIVTGFTETGFENYSPERFYGEIIVYDVAPVRWKLNKYKNGLNELRKMARHLFTHIEPVLRDLKKEANIVNFPIGAPVVAKFLEKHFAKRLMPQAQGKEIRKPGGKRPGIGNGEEGNSPGEPKTRNVNRVDPLQSGKAHGKAKNPPVINVEYRELGPLQPLFNVYVNGDARHVAGINVCINTDHRFTDCIKEIPWLMNVTAYFAVILKWFIDIEKAEQSTLGSGELNNFDRASELFSAMATEVVAAIRINRP